MSTQYEVEPPTNGKVILKTSCGDIDIELWSKGEHFFDFLLKFLSSFLHVFLIRF